MIVGVYSLNTEVSSRADLIGWLHLVDGRVEAGPPRCETPARWTGCSGSRSAGIGARASAPSGSRRGRTPESFWRTCTSIFAAPISGARSRRKICSRTRRPICGPSGAHLTRDDWRGIQNLAHAWGPEHVLARWGRLRLEIIWVRYL